MWSKMYYVEKCGEICHVDKCFHMTDISTWEMKNVETICFYALILHNHISLSQLTMYCYNLRCFVAKSVLLQFTRFCVEKNWTRNCACGENKTNIRYGQTLTNNMSTKPTSMHIFSQISHTCTHQHSKSQALATSHKGTTLTCKLCTSFANLALNLATLRRTSQGWASIQAITSGSAGVIPSSRSPPSSHLLSLIDFEALSPSLVLILWFVAFPIVTRLWSNHVPGPSANLGS